jgi:hypothetical protein
MDGVSLELLKWALGIAASLLLVLIAAVGFFVKREIADIRQARDSGSNALTEKEVRKLIEDAQRKESQRVDAEIKSVKGDIRSLSSSLLESITAVDQKINSLLMHLIGNNK